jgi:hypothetical protein
VTAALTAALPAAAQADLIQAISVTGKVKVPAGQTRTLFLKCPARAVALNAATTTSALPSTNSVPRFTARGWELHFTAGSRSTTGSGVLRCVRFDLPSTIKGVTLAVETKIEPVNELSPGDTQSLTMRCSHGFVPTGWGLDREAPGPTVAAAVPTKHAWKVVIENDGKAAAGGTLYTRCLEQKQFAESGQRHSFAMRVANASVRGGSATRSCRSSEFSVSTGLSLPTQADIFLTGTGPFGRRSGEWHFAKASGAGPVKTSLVCLSTTTAFH